MQEHFKKHGIIHMSWLIFLCVAIIIILASVDLGRVEGIKDILGFAVSFASLILALIAIGQSALSSSSFTSALTSIGSTGDKVEQSATSLETAAQAVPEALRTIEEKLRKPAEDLLAAATEISGRSVAIEGAATEMRKAQQTFKIGVVERQIGATAPSNEGTGFKAGATSNGIAMALLMCMKSLETQKSFNPLDFFDSKNADIGNYVQGALDAMMSLTPIQITREQKDTYKVSSMRDAKPTVEAIIRNLFKEIESEKPEILVRTRDRVIAYFEDGESKHAS